MEPVVREPVVRAMEPVVRVRDQRFIDQRFPDQRFIDQRFPDQRFIDQRFINQRFPDQRFLDQRFMDQRFPDQSFLNQRFMDQSFLNQNQSFPDQSFARRTRRIKSIDPAIRHNVKNITHYERMAQHGFTTTIQLFKLTARKNFIIRNHGGSGECLFLSLYDTLTRADPNITHNKTPHDIRVEIVNYVMKHLKQSANPLTGQTFENAIQHGIMVNGQTLYMNNYAHEMMKQSTYGTDLEISAAAQLYKINIYVVNREGLSYDQLYIGNGTPNWQNTWYIFNINYAHYTSLLCNDGPGGCPY
jgi:hypothetical protein